MATLDQVVLDHAAPRAASRPSLLPWIVACAAIIASLDLGFAVVWWGFEGVAPLPVFQSIASWALRRDVALTGGLTTAMFGLLLQICIMATITALYFALSRYEIRLRRQPLRWGALYGAAVYVIQHVVIVPHFSAAASTASPRLDWTLACLIVYVTLVGIPCALFARAMGARALGKI